jgi:hypothetical protein
MRAEGSVDRGKRHGAFIARGATSASTVTAGMAVPGDDGHGAGAQKVAEDCGWEASATVGGAASQRNAACASINLGECTMRSLVICIRIRRPWLETPIDP